MSTTTYFVISFKGALDANETVIKHLRYSSKEAVRKAYNRIPKDLQKLFRIYKIQILNNGKVKVTKANPHVG